jgi:hypothetical protein
MSHHSTNIDSSPITVTRSEVGVYDCEVFLKFRLIEDKALLRDRERLLEMLLDAFSYGADEYLEPMQVKVEANEISELEVSPEMRRQLIRLRNASV